MGVSKNYNQMNNVDVLGEQMVAVYTHLIIFITLHICVFFPSTCSLVCTSRLWYVHEFIIVVI